MFCRREKKTTHTKRSLPISPKCNSPKAVEIHDKSPKCNSPKNVQNNKPHPIPLPYPARITQSPDFIRIRQAAQLRGANRHSASEARARWKRAWSILRKENAEPKDAGSGGDLRRKEQDVNMNWSFMLCVGSIVLQCMWFVCVRGLIVMDDFRRVATKNDFSRLNSFGELHFGEMTTNPIGGVVLGSDHTGWILMNFTWISPFAVRTLPIIRTREFHMKSVKIDILGWDSLYGQTSAKCKYILFRLFYTIMIYQTQKNNMIGKGNDLLAKAMREMTVKYRNRQTKLHQFTMNVRRVTMIVRFIIRKTEAVQLLVEVWS